MKKLLLGLFAVSLSLAGNAAELKGKDADRRIKGTQDLRFTERSTLPDYIRFEESSQPEINSLEVWLKANAGLNESCGFNLLSTEPDQIGFVHYRYQQTYNGYPLLHTMYIAHTRNGKIISANGFLTNQFPKSVNVVLSESAAMQKALQNINATVYKWQLQEEESFLKREQNDANSTFFPKGELVLAASASDLQRGYQLAWQFDIYAHEPLQRYYVYVDAQSGKIIEKLNRIHEGNANGSALTGYSGTQALTTDSTGVGNYRLRETGRGLGIETYNLQKGTSYGAAVDFTDTDNYWNNVNTNKDQYATDAHLATEKTYDYYFNTYGRNSINNAGLKLLSYVHYSTNYVNAFWDGTRMTYGDGNATYNPLTSLDIGGHEITHGLTSYTANLNYSYQSGALNESFSDIFGTVVENYAAPAYFDWLIGEDIGAAFRSHSNPNAYGDPDTYLGTNWYSGSGDNGGVHTNSGVQNHWFYRLAVGGSGTNDIGNAYNITGIGITSAAAIAYRNLTIYLTPTSQYADARFYAIQAATDLFGPCSPQVIATTNAWFAVGVGTSQSGTAATITAGGPTTFCEGGSVTLTANAGSGSTYQWNRNGIAVSGATSSAYVATLGGSYTCSTVTCGSSFTSAPTTVTTNSVSATISPTGTVNICNGNSTTLNANTSTGYGYQWNLNGAQVSGATSSSYITSSAGNYSVTYLAQTFPGQVQTNNTTSNIVDNTCTGTANTTITVSGLATAINPSGITVTVNLTHTYDGDIDVVLQAPNGDILGLSNQAGGAGDNFVNTVFSDAGATTVASGTAPFTGTYKPWASTWTSCVPITKTSFASLGNGSINPNGAWTLRVYDRASVDIGTLNNWTLNIPSYTVPSPNCGPVTSPVTTVSVGSLSVNAGTYNSVCTNSSLVPLSGTPSGGTFSGTGVSGNTFNPGVGAGSYSVTYNYTDVNGCSGSASTTIVVNSLPAVTADNVSGCDGNSIALSGTPAGGTWSVANPYTGPSTTYTHTFTDANGCTNTSAVSIITVNPLPTVTASDASGCAGSSIALSGSPAGGTYSVPNPYTGGSATYTYTYTDGNGCTNTSSPAIITVNPLPTVTADNVSGCTGTSISLSGTPAGGTWSVANPYTGSSTTYTHTYTDGNGCTNTSAAANITVNALPSVSFSGLAASYNVSAAAATLIGSPAGGTFSGPGISGNIFTPAAAGIGGPYTISYAYTDGNGCSNSSAQQTTVTNCAVTATPGSITSIGGTAKMCPGDSKSYKITAVSGASSYTWTPPAGASISAGQGTVQVTVNYTAGFTASGILSVVANNACGSSAPRNLTITRNTLATPSVITGLAFGVCNNAGVPYSVTNVAGATYNWSFSVTTAGISTGQGSNAVTADYSAAYVTGALRVTATNACGTSPQRSLTVKATPATPAAISGPTLVCANQFGVPYSITPIATATSYTWTGMTGSHISDGVVTSAGASLTTTATSVTVNFGSSTGKLNVKANNACGAGTNKALTIGFNCRESETNILNLADISVYPNPTAGTFTIQFSNKPATPVRIEMIDVIGKVVDSFETSDETIVLDKSNLATGIYYLSAKNSDGMIVKKIIISK